MACIYLGAVITVSVAVSIPVGIYLVACLSERIEHRQREKYFREAPKDIAWITNGVWASYAHERRRK